MPFTLRQPDHSGRDPYPLLPLGDLDDSTIDPEKFFQESRDLYVASGIIARTAFKGITGDIGEQIRAMQEQAVNCYVNLAKSRMRKGDILRIPALGGVVSLAKVHHLLKEANGQRFNGLLQRASAKNRIASALTTGSDRDSYSRIEDEFQHDAMQRFELEKPEDVTFTKPMSTEAQNPIVVSPDNAVLIYAPEALQTITPADPDLYIPTFDFQVFVPGLKDVALLAIVHYD